MEKLCEKHGLTKHYKDTPYHWKCQRCNTEAVTEYRRRNKRLLIEYFGGKCVVCGYLGFGVSSYGTRTQRFRVRETWYSQLKALD